MNKRASSISDGIIISTEPVDRNDSRYHDSFLEVSRIISEQASFGNFPKPDDLANLATYKIVPEMKEIASGLGISGIDIEKNPMLIEDLALYALENHLDIYDKFLDAYPYSDAVVNSLMGGITDSQKETETRISPKIHGKPGIGYKIAALGALALLGASLGAGCMADEKKLDTDKDGISDWEEKNTYKTDPKNPDTDNDGIGDSLEIKTYHTDPLKSDTDNDGIDDNHEIKTYLTDPLRSDTDGDGFTDGFEVKVAKLDPKTKNDRYVLISSRNYKTDSDRAAVQVPDMYDFLTKEGKIPKENIIYLQKPSYTQFKNAVDEIARKADSNDIVFIELHGETIAKVDQFGRISDQRYMFSDKNVLPSQVGSLLDNIHAKSTVVCVELCEGGYYLDAMKDPGRIVITGSDSTQVSPNAQVGLFLTEAMGNDVCSSCKGKYYSSLNENPDRDGNGYVSVKEAYDMVKKKMANIKMTENGLRSNNALFSDPSGIAGSTYLIEYKLPSGYNV